MPAERAVPPSPRTVSPKDLGTKILVPIVNLIVNLVVNLVMNLVVNPIVNLIVNIVVNTLSCKRFDAKRNYVLRHPPPCLSTVLYSQA